MTTTEAVRERPIIFSGDMVRALLGGRKTQTRRVMNLPVTPLRDKAQEVVGFIGRLSERSTREYVWATLDDFALACPFGKPGDRLWVREAWRVTHWWPDYGRVEVLYEVDGATRTVEIPEDSDPDGDVFERLWIQSTDDLLAAGYRWESEDVPPEWHGEGPEPLIAPTRTRSPIYMPRWASRITLEVTDVRVERLQEISPNDAVAEGVEPDCDHPSMTLEYGCTDCMNTGYASDPRDEFAGLWDSINGQRPGCSWADNPWTWAITFKRVEEAS